MGYYRTMINQRKDTMKPKYIVYRCSADADNTEVIWDAPAKPTLEQLYKLIGCDTVEMHKGTDKSVSNRPFDMWMDESSKLKGRPKNLRATNAWFRWLTKTNTPETIGNAFTPGSYITGPVVVYKKIKDCYTRK